MYIKKLENNQAVLLLALLGGCSGPSEGNFISIRLWESDEELNQTEV
jgi:hypothetical protein